MCMAIGGIVGAIGSMVSAGMQAQAMNAQAAFHDQQARLEKQRRKFLMKRQERETARVEGKQRNTAAGSGFTQGSFSEQMEDTYEQLVLDEGIVWFNGKVAENNEKAKAEIKRAEASATMFSGAIGAISPILKGFG